MFVPDARIVERVKIGGERKRPGTSGWNLPLAAVYLGIGQAACDAACHYANNRVPAALGAPIAGQPHIQQWIGDMDVKLRAARTVLHDTARAWVGTQRVARRDLAPVDRRRRSILCTNAACAVTETALRVAGGFSMTRAIAAGTLFPRCARRVVPAAAGRPGAGHDRPRGAGRGEKAMIASATELAGQIRARSISPVELMRAALERIERSQPVLNAFITVAADQAMAQARRSGRGGDSGATRSGRCMACRWR